MVSMMVLTIFAVFAFVNAEKSGLSSVNRFLSATASLSTAYKSLNFWMACEQTAIFLKIELTVSYDHDDQ